MSEWRYVELSKGETASKTCPDDFDTFKSEWQCPENAAEDIAENACFDGAFTVHLEYDPVFTAYKEKSDE